MNSEELFSHLKALIKSKNSPINFQTQEISWGDRWYSEHGEEIKFRIWNKEYRVGYLYITEDSEDWGQAESYRVTWCKCGESNVKADRVLELINNYKTDKRDWLIKEIIQG